MTKIKLIKSPNKSTNSSMAQAPEAKVNINYGENVFKIKSLYSKEDVILDYEDLTMGTMVFGSTGSGKTTTVMYPLVDRFLRDGHSGVILDVKGDYASFIRSNGYADNVLFLSDTKDSLKINALEGIDRNEFRDLIKSIVPRAPNDQFWGTTAEAACVLIYDLYQCLYKQAPSLSVLHEYLVCPDKLARKTASYLKSEYAEKISVDLKNSIEAMLVDNFSCLRYGAYLESQAAANKGSPDSAHASDWVLNKYDYSKAGEQYTWHHSRLIEVLSPFAKGSPLAENFCSTEPLSLGDFVYRVKKTLVVDLPKSQYGSAADFLCKLIKNRLYKAVFTYDLEYRKQNEYGSKNYTFLLIDEYQDHKEFNTSSKYNDNNFVDKSRQYGHINVFSTQGISSLLSDNVSDSTYGVYSFLQNMRNMIVLGGSCVESMRHVSNLEGDDPMDELKFPKELGIAYVYSGKNKKQNGGAVHKLCKLGVYHNDFIGKSYLRESKFFNATANVETVDNIFFKKDAATSQPIGEFGFDMYEAPVKVKSKYKSTHLLSEIINSLIIHLMGKVDLKFTILDLFSPKALSRVLDFDFWILNRKTPNESIDNYVKNLAKNAENFDTLSDLRNSHLVCVQSLIDEIEDYLIIKEYKNPELMSLFTAINCHYPDKDLYHYLSLYKLLDIHGNNANKINNKYLYRLLENYLLTLGTNTEYMDFIHLVNLFAVFKEMKRRKTKLNFNFPKS